MRTGNNFEITANPMENIRAAMAQGSDSLLKAKYHSAILPKSAVRYLLFDRDAGNVLIKRYLNGYIVIER